MSVYKLPFVHLMENLFLLVCSLSLLFSKTSGKQQAAFVKIYFREESSALSHWYFASSQKASSWLQLGHQRKNDFFRVTSVSDLGIITFCFVYSNLFYHHILWFSPNGTIFRTPSVSFLKIHNSLSIFSWESSHTKKSVRRIDNERKHTENLQLFQAFLRPVGNGHEQKTAVNINVGNCCQINGIHVCGTNITLPHTA